MLEFEDNLQIHRSDGRMLRQLQWWNNTEKKEKDITAKINGNIVNYNSLPANSDIADTFNGSDCIIITDNKEAMNSEILALK